MMDFPIDYKANVLIQGITGQEGSYWTKRMLDLGTRIVAGVTPGKGGGEVFGVPVYDTVVQAMEDHQINASVLFVKAPFVCDAVIEALEGGCQNIVILADGVPIHDSLKLRYTMKEKNAFIIGPNTSGLAIVGEIMLGFLPVWLDHVYRPGPIGILTRSGSLTNEVSSHIVAAGLGQSLVIGVGGDSVPCTRMVDVLPYYEKDPKTKALVLVGELGGTMEEEVAEAIKVGILTKPVISFISGRSAPPGKKMGHAGAILSHFKGSVMHKESCLREVGVSVASRPSEIGYYLKKLSIPDLP